MHVFVRLEQTFLYTPCSTRCCFFSSSLWQPCPTSAIQGSSLSLSCLLAYCIWDERWKIVEATLTRKPNPEVLSRPLKDIVEYVTQACRTSGRLEYAWTVLENGCVSSPEASMIAKICATSRASGLRNAQLLELWSRREIAWMDVIVSHTWGECRGKWETALVRRLKLVICFSRSHGHGMLQKLPRDPHPQAPQHAH